MELTTLWIEAGRVDNMLIRASVMTHKMIVNIIIELNKFVYLLNLNIVSLIYQSI